MALRQYVGARYVTKVYENSLDPSSAEWESGVEYEPLTMVTYQNSSFLSKKTVPISVGNPGDNPSYWAQTGFYNGQISYLQSEIDGLSDRIDDILDPPHKIILCGDSYGVHNAGITNFYEVFESLSGVTDVTNLSVNGAGMGISGNSITSQISALSVDNDVTDVIVCAGANDGHRLAIEDISASDVRDGVTSFVNTALTKFPNAKIYIGFVGSFDNRFVNIRAKDIQSFNACVDYYYDTATAISTKVTILKDIEYVLRNYIYLGTDGVHPNQNGMNKLGSALYSLWKGKPIDYAYPRAFVTMTMLDNSTAAF